MTTHVGQRFAGGQDQRGESVRRQSSLRSIGCEFDPKARTIVGETTEDPKYNTFFCTKKKYGDFELTCKVQLRDGVGNSGIQIRSEVFDKEKFKVKGPQPDIGQMVIDGATRLGVNDVEAIAPCVVLTVLILAATSLGDGLRDAFDPQSIH